MSSRDEFDFDKEFEEFKKRINNEIEKNRTSNDASNKININPTEDISNKETNDSQDSNLSDADYHDYHHMDVIDDDSSENEEYIYEDEIVEESTPPLYKESDEENSLNSLQEDTLASPISDGVKVESITEDTTARGGEINGEKNADSGESFYKETVRGQKKNAKKRTFRRAVALTVLASIIGGSCLGLTVGAGSTFAKHYISKMPKEKYSLSDNATEAEKQGSNSTSNVTPSPVSSDPVSQVIANVKPSVVSITVTVKGGNTGFFSIPDQQGAGSGIIFEDDGETIYIVTNKHVIDSANSAGVAVGDAEPVEAKLVGKSSETDLAVISVSKADLLAVGVTDVVVAKFGDSDLMSVGDTVVAIGNALGEGNTATRGIVSAKDKEIRLTTRETIVALQTDAAINNGNSGGALINMNSEVIGINTAKLSEVSVEGMGYSIPSNEVIPVIEDIMNYPEENRVYLGVSVEDVTSEMAELYSLPAMGVFVSSVTEGLGAFEAGIEPYDIITSLDGETVHSTSSLLEMLKKYKDGDQVVIKVLRNGKEPMEFNVKLKAAALSAFE